MRYIASVSFGKDSLAMLLLLIEKKYPLDEVVFYDTGMEFQAIYNLRNKIKPLLERYGIKYTELKPKCDFVYKMFEKPVKAKNGTTHYGYSWCGGCCRWGTTEKLQTIEKHCKQAIQYVGIAADEWKRLANIFDFEKNSNGQPILDYKGCIQNHQQISNFNKIYPLVDWGISEADCLEYCRKQGIEWLENGIDLYNILDRVSCWCCGNKNILELYNIWRYLPTYWLKLRNLQSRTERPFKKPYTIEDLCEKFYLHKNGKKEWKYLNKAKTIKEKL